MRQPLSPDAAIDARGRVAQTRVMEQPFSYGSGQEFKLKSKLAQLLHEQHFAGETLTGLSVPRLIDTLSFFPNESRINSKKSPNIRRGSSNRCKLTEIGPQFDWMSQHIGCWNEAQ